MKTLILSTALIFSITFFACKKKDTTPEPASTTAGSPTNPSTFDGFLQATMYASFTGSAVANGTNCSVNAYLMSSPSNSINYAIGINSGTLTLNTTKLKYAGFRYYDTTYALNLSSQQNYQLQSSGSFPSFTYNNVDSFPKFTYNYNNLINDTLSKSANYNVPIGNFNYGDEIKCSLQDLTNYTLYVTKTVNVGTSQIQYTPTDLSIFNSNSNISLSVELKKYNKQTIGGKTLRFESNRFSSFNVFVKP